MQTVLRHSSRAVRHIVFAGAAFAAVAAHPSAAVAQEVPVSSLSARDAARLIQRERGKVRLVLVYNAGCPASRKMFPEFLDLAERSRQKNVSVLAFSTDATPEITARYLAGARLPFRPVQIRPWRSGEFDTAMRPTGIDIGKTFGTPLIAVIDRNGRVVGQWEGSSGARRAVEWLNSVGVRP